MGKNNSVTWLDRLSRMVSNKRLVILVVLLVVAAVFTYGATKIKGEVILQDMLPADHPFLKLNNRFAEVFGSGGSTIAIALRVKSGDVFNEAFMTKLQSMTKEVLTWDEVYRSLTVSLATRSVKVVKTLKKGEINIEPIMWPDVPNTPEAMDVLKTNVLSSPAYNGSLVSRDGTAALIMTEMKENISYEQAFALLTKLAKEYTDDTTEVHLIGYPVQATDLSHLRDQLTPHDDHALYHFPKPGRHVGARFKRLLLHHRRVRHHGLHGVQSESSPLCPCLSCRGHDDKPFGAMHQPLS